MPRDAQGNSITGRPESAAAYDAAISDYYALGGDPVGKLKTALARDPGFALGASAIAALFLIGGAPADHPDVAASLATARLAAEGANPREALHVEAVETWAEGGLRDAAAVFEEILVDAPTDALALRLSQDLHFMLGASAAMRDGAARVLAEWRDEDPLTSFVLGMRAFGLEETGAYAEAEDFALEALRRNPADVWAAHALAHVYEMTGRPAAGLAFLSGSRRDWSAAHFMAGHNGWHGALYLIELGRGAEALAGFDRHVLPALARDAALDRIDAASLLWRLELEGIEVGDRWAKVAGAFTPHIGEHTLIFNDLHAALALGRSGDRNAVARFIKSFDAFLAEGQGDNARVSAEVGRPLIEAMLAFAARRYGEACEGLLPLRYDVWRIGGSIAQREIVDLTLIAAAEKAGEKNLTRALLAERAALRATERWRGRLSRARADGA